MVWAEPTLPVSAVETPHLIVGSSTTTVLPVRTTASVSATTVKRIVSVVGDITLRGLAGSLSVIVGVEVSVEGSVVVVVMIVV